MLRLLGRGGMGEVWLAEDTQLLRQVAVKLLPTVYASDRNYLQDFAREARSAAALEHPHILPVHDFGEQQLAEDEVITYLVTPYMSSGSLRDRIHDANGPLPPDRGHWLPAAGGAGHRLRAQPAGAAPRYQACQHAFAAIVAISCRLWACQIAYQHNTAQSHPCRRWHARIYGPGAGTR